MVKSKKLRHFHTVLKPNEYSILDGEIYEYYCYEQIVNKYTNLHFISQIENKPETDGFYVSSSGSICYRSNTIDLGEFDIIGFDSKENVHWYEITKQKVNIDAVNDKICRKKELMSKLFGSYNLYLVVPEKNEKLSSVANLLIFPEPDYIPLRKPEYTFHFHHEKFLNLEYLNKKAHKYDFIQDLMTRSNNFFKNKNQVYKSYLFERLYDLDTINTNKISYYNVEKNTYGKITEKNHHFYKKNEKIKSIKATYKEIIQLRAALSIKEN